MQFPITTLLAVSVCLHSDRRVQRSALAHLLKTRGTRLAADIWNVAGLVILDAGVPRTLTPADTK